MADEAFTYNFKLTDNSEEILRLTDEAIEYLLELNDAPFLEYRSTYYKCKKSF